MIEYTKECALHQACHHLPHLPLSKGLLVSRHVDSQTREAQAVLTTRAGNSGIQQQTTMLRLHTLDSYRTETASCLHRCACVFVCYHVLNFNSKTRPSMHLSQIVINWHVTRLPQGKSLEVCRTANMSRWISHTGSYGTVCSTDAETCGAFFYWEKSKEELHLTFILWDSLAFLLGPLGMLCGGVMELIKLYRGIAP